MLFFPSDRKERNLILVFGMEKHENNFNCFEISLLLPIDKNQNYTKISQILSKWYQNGVEGVKVLDDKSCRT